jgi:hypothetical protein
MLSNDRIRFLAQSNDILARRIESSLDGRRYDGGDPCNGFRELRRCLIEKGIDTRIFSFGSIPVPDPTGPININTENIISREDSADNSFFFELRKMIDTATGLKVNVLALMFRVFFVDHQSSNTFVVQAILNHHKDCVYQLSAPYNDTIHFLEDRGWNKPNENYGHNKISYFEKQHTDIYAFLREFDELLMILQRSGVMPNFTNPTPAAF